jgi:hypothetical protein
MMMSITKMNIMMITFMVMIITMEITMQLIIIPMTIMPAIIILIAGEPIIAMFITAPIGIHA